MLTDPAPAAIVDRVAVVEVVRDVTVRAGVAPGSGDVLTKLTGVTWAALARNTTV